MLKIILVGDAASGKSSFLTYLKTVKPQLNLFLEEGWKGIPKDKEDDKFKSNLWFIDLAGTPKFVNSVYEV